MCGIAAVINGTLEESEAMAYAIRRRGIKANTTSVNELTVSFVHLPIVDDITQPCTYGIVTVWINGFISNWKELSKKYGKTFRNDAEYLAYHLDQNRPKRELNGFFAVLYYQDGVKMFTDRYGIKQLYTYKHLGTTYICSEPKGIKAVCDLKIDFDAMADWEYSLGVMTDNTIWAGVERVECLPFVKPEKLTRFDISYDEARDKLSSIWWSSVIERNYYEGAGCYLSGGVDSGLIAKDLLPEYSFSIDYLNELSESDNIKLNSIGNHLTLMCTDYMKYQSLETLKALDDLKVGSCYTNFAIAELASKFCKVMYSGAGGDEVFNGYTHRYNKPINGVIKRTNKEGKQYDISHKEYDWRYLKGILVVEDRMSGWHTMETRYPLLDNDFVDFALRLPDEYLDNKRILKDISGLHPDVINGKKRGFSNPHFTNDEWVKFCKENVG